MTPPSGITKKDEILDYRARGYSLKEIAKLVKVSVGYVRATLREFMKKTEQPW